MAIEKSNILDIFVKFAFKDPKAWKAWYKKNKKRFFKLVKKHTKNRRNEMRGIIDQKKNIPCKKCKKSYHPAAMGFVHKDGKDKDFSIYKATKTIYSLDRLNDELEKCDVYCSNCIKEMKAQLPQNEQTNKKRRRKKLLEIVNKMKDKPCKDCGEKFPPYIMELDHIEDNKVDAVAKMVNTERAMGIIQEEFDKTEVLCTNCHRIRTYKRRAKKD